MEKTRCMKCKKIKVVLCRECMGEDIDAFFARRLNEDRMKLVQLIMEFILK